MPAIIFVVRHFNCGPKVQWNNEQNVRDESKKMSQGILEIHIVLQMGHCEKDEVSRSSMKSETKA